MPPDTAAARAAPRCPHAHVDPVVEDARWERKTPQDGRRRVAEERAGAHGHRVLLRPPHRALPRGQRARIDSRDRTHHVEWNTRRSAGRPSGAESVRTDRYRWAN